MKRIALLAVLSIAPLVHAQNIPLPTDCTSPNLGPYLLEAVSTTATLNGFLLTKPAAVKDPHVWWHLASIHLIAAQANAVIAGCGFVVGAWAWPTNGGVLPTSVQNVGGLVEHYIPIQLADLQRFSDPNNPNPGVDASDVATQFNLMMTDIAMFQEHPQQVTYP